MEYFYVSIQPANLNAILSGSRSTKQPAGNVYWAHGSDICLVHYGTDKPFRLADEFTSTASSDRFYDLNQPSITGSRYFLLSNNVVLCRDSKGLYQVSTNFFGTNNIYKLIRNGVPINSPFVGNGYTGLPTIYQYDLGKPDTCCITYPAETDPISFALLSEGGLVINSSIKSTISFYKADGTVTTGKISLSNGLLKLDGDAKYAQFTNAPVIDIGNQSFAYNPPGATLIQDASSGLYFYSYLSSVTLNITICSGPFYTSTGKLYTGSVTNGTNINVVYNGILYPQLGNLNQFYVSSTNQPLGLFTPNETGIIDTYGAIFNSRNYGTKFAITNGSAIFSDSMGASQPAVAVQLGSLATYADAPLSSASYVAAPSGIYGTALVLNYSYFPHAMLWLVLIILMVVIVLVSSLVIAKRRQLLNAVQGAKNSLKV